MRDEKRDEPHKNLPRRSIEWLSYLLEGESHGFAGMGSGRIHRKRDADRLVAAGLVTMEFLPRADDDGFLLEPERHGRSYLLTEAGRSVARGLDEDAKSATIDEAGKA